MNTNMRLIAFILMLITPIKHILLTISLILGATVSSAEPSSGISILMDRPMSLFDWGMYRMGKSLKEVDASAFVLYDWDSNKIMVVSSEGISDSVSSMEEAKTNCNKRFTKWDRQFSVSAGKDMFSYCRICNMFAHTGYSFSKHDEAIKDLKERVYYQAKVGGWNASVKGYICTRKVYDTLSSTSVRER